jgi:O-antigen/teichoic acid export membrane protein
LEQVGLYYLALRLADVMRLAGDVLVNAWRPVFFKQADDETFRKEDVPRVFRLATVVLAGVCVMLSVFSREVVAVFAAPAYQQAYVFVPFLAAAMFFKGVQSFPYLVIWLRRKTSWVPVLSIFTFVVSIGANVAFARRWGAMGVAAALFTAYVFLSAAMFLVARRLYDMDYPWRTLSSVAVLSIGAVAASASLPAQPLSIVGKFVIVIAYACGLIVSGSVRPDELRALRWSEAMPGTLDRKTAVS